LAQNQEKEKSFLRESVMSLLPFVKRVTLFSVFTTLLILAPSVYMLEVYDRVVNSRNATTLLMLTIWVVGAYLILQLLEWVRRQVMQEASLVLDEKVREGVVHAVFKAQLNNLRAAGSEALKDLKTICDFLPSQAFLAFIDVPLALLILILVFLINPFLGWFAVGGALVLFAIGMFNERRIKQPFEDASRNRTASQLYVAGGARGAQVIESMGMLDQIHARWLKLHTRFVDKQAQASDHAGANAALSKMIQTMTGSLILGLGAWFAIRGELTGGLMIVASILGGRVVAPLVQLIANWRQVIAVREAYVRLENLLKLFPMQGKSMSLPEPAGNLSVEGVIAGPPQSRLQVLKGITFRVPAGNSLAVVGPTASGKTTLARLLVGIWPSMNGAIRLDGSDIYKWDKEELGPHLGYLPQDIELFDGTLAENIARFGEIDEEKVNAACNMVGLSDIVGQLPQGLHTPIGNDGAFLSGGQRQRVALARAVYGMPKFVVLDEPNSSLDEAGDAALVQALRTLKANGTTVIVVTHRMNILSAIDYMLVLVDGRISKFGPCKEVLSALQGATNSTTSKPPVTRPAGGGA